jgi:hypothetical protein
MQVEIDDRRRHVLHGGKPLVEVARRLDFVEQRLGHRLAGLVVPSEFLEHLAMHDPVLVELRRQLHEVALDAGA